MLDISIEYLIAGIIRPQMTQNNIKRDYLWNTIGVFAQNAISPLLLIVITRNNGIDDSGLFSFAFSVSIIFWAVAMWGGRTYQVSDTKRKFTNKEYVAVRIILGCLVLLASVVFSLVNHYDPTKTMLIIALVLFKVVESIADAIYGVLQVKGLLYDVGKSLLAKATTGFILFFILNILTHNILIGCMGILVANITIVLLYDLPLAKRVEGFSGSGATRRNILRIIKTCFPLVAVSFLAAFSLNIPRYFIDCYHGQEIGYFGIIAMPATLMGLVITFIMQPNVVQLSSLHNQGRYRSFEKIVMKMIVVAVLVGVAVLIVTYAVGPFILKTVFAVDFSKYQIALTVLAGGAILGALVAILINILTILRKFYGQLYVLLATNLVLAVLSPMVIERYATLGAVILFGATNAVQLLLLALIYHAHIRKGGDEKKN